MRAKGRPRRLQQVKLAQSGQTFEGEDLLIAIDDVHKRQFDKSVKSKSSGQFLAKAAFHFHPNVAVRWDQNKNLISLALKNGEIWIFDYGQDPQFVLRSMGLSQAQFVQLGIGQTQGVHFEDLVEQVRNPIGGQGKRSQQAFTHGVTGQKRQFPTLHAPTPSLQHLPTEDPSPVEEFTDVLLDITARFEIFEEIPNLFQKFSLYSDKVYFAEQVFVRKSTKDGRL